MASKNSCFEIFVCGSIIFYLLSNKFMTISMETFVNSEITLRDIRL